MTCVITDETTGVSIEAVNQCFPEGNVCARMDAPTGTKYEACGSIHAEIIALMEARSKGFTLEGATARVYGHTYVCDDCQVALRNAGITRILLRGKEVA